MATYDDILGGGGLKGVRNPVRSLITPVVDATRTYVTDPNSSGGAGGGSNSGSSASATTPTPTRSVSRTKTTTTTTTPASSAATPTPTTTDGDGEKKLSYVEMYQQMNPYTPPTPEEVKKEKRKQKRRQVFAAIGDAISAMSNIYFTSQYSPNAWDANNSMSKKTRERWEKAQKEKDANQRTYMDGYLRAMAMDDAKARDDRNWRHTLEREEVEDKRYEDTIAHRDKREGIEDARYDDEIRHRGEREKVQDDQWQKSFDQAAYQFRVTSSLRRQEINLHAKSLAHQMASDNAIITLGTGKGQVSIPKAALNDANISYIFNKLPESVRATVVGPAYKVKGRGGKEEVRYGPPDSNAMLIAIGANIETCPDVQAAVKEVSGRVQTSTGGKEHITNF